MDKQETGERILDTIFKKLDLKPLIDSAIIQALTDEAKDELIKGIMSYLSESTSNYGSETHLQAAFNSSIYAVVNEQMKKLIDNDPVVSAEIERCVSEATKRFIKLDKESLISSLASVMTKAFSKDY